jgi:hypothetical protein
MLRSRPLRMLACYLPVLPDFRFRNHKRSRHERLQQKKEFLERDDRFETAARTDHQRHALARAVHAGERRIALPGPRRQRQAPDQERVGVGGAAEEPPRVHPQARAQVPDDQVGLGERRGQGLQRKLLQEQGHVGGPQSQEDETDLDDELGLDAPLPEPPQLVRRGLVRVRRDGEREQRGGDRGVGREEVGDIQRLPHRYRQVQGEEAQPDELLLCDVTRCIRGCSCCPISLFLV